MANTPLNMYLSSFDGELILDVDPTIASSTPTLPTFDDVATFYLPLTYLQTMFYITFNSANEINTFPSSLEGISNLSYNVNVDNSLYLNSAMATLLAPTLYPASATLNYPNNCNVEQDFLRFISFSIFGNSIKGVDLFTNTNALLNDIYSKLNDVWTVQKNLLFNGQSSGVYSTTDVTDISDERTNICREIYSQMISYQPQRFTDLPTNTTNASSYFNLPFVEGDALCFKLVINTEMPSTIVTAFTHNTSTYLTRTYLVKIVAESDHTIITNNNIVGSFNVGNTSQYGVYYTSFTGTITGIHESFTGSATGGTGPTGAWNYGETGATGITGLSGPSGYSWTGFTGPNGEWAYTGPVGYPL